MICTRENDMSLTYIGAGGLFTRLGKFVKYANVHLAAQTAPAAEVDAILDQYEDARGLVNGLYSSYLSFPSQEQAKVALLVATAGRTISDLQDNLFADGPALGTVLPYLYTQMVADREYVTPVITTAPAVTANAANTGYGTTAAATLVTCILNPGANGVNGGIDQRVRPETLRVLCTDDLTTSSRVQYGLVGQPIISVYNGIDTYGSGRSTLSPADISNIVQSGQFDSWDGATPSLPIGWTCVQGADGVNIIDHAAGGLRGHDSLKLAGNSVATTISCNQLVNMSMAKPYLVSVWLKKAGMSSATGSTLTVNLTDGAGVNVALFATADPNTLTTSYVNYKAVVNLSVVAATLSLDIVLASASGLTSSQ